MSKVEIISTEKKLGKTINVYGTFEDPLFLAKDVAEWIDYSWTNSKKTARKVKQMLETVDDSEKFKGILDTRQCSTPSFHGGLRDNTEMWFLTENGLYEVLMLSRKPIAKQFKYEVKNILKTIRKNGLYATDVTIDKMLNDPDFAIGLLTRLKEEKAARIEAERVNAILTHVNKTYTATEIAKEIGFKSATEMNKILGEMKIQYKMNDTWIMYSKYSSLGYDLIKQEVLDSGRVIYHRRFTQLGREFILKTLNIYNSHE